MEKLIRQSDVIDALNEVEDIKGFAYRSLHDAIMALDAVEPKKGKWIYRGECEYRCSECGKIVFADDDNELNYCCSCGARMVTK